jgi:hypothetical protein
MTLFGHGISLLFPVEVRSSSASQARPGWLHNEPVYYSTVVDMSTYRISADASRVLV